MSGVAVVEPWNGEYEWGWLPRPGYKFMAGYTIQHGDHENTGRFVWGVYGGKGAVLGSGVADSPEAAFEAVTGFFAQESL